MAKSDLPYISVIVPFYNIEECVEYCLDSLVAQDYGGDYEIICIDDGSTDGTPAVLDTYASGHSGVRVFHKPNGGLSDARNFGVGLAVGEYISFVDGDDVVSPYYLSSLAGGLKAGEDAVVVGVQRSVNFSDAASVSWDEPSGLRSSSVEELYRSVCFQRLLASAWGKIAKKSVYADNPFPVGRVYEDTYVFGDHIGAAEKIVLVDGPIYGYVVRDGSIVRPKKERLERCIQQFEAIDRFCGCIDGYFAESSDEQVVFRALEYSRLWRRLDLVEDFPDEAKSLQGEVRNFIKMHLGQLRACPDVAKGNKARFALLSQSPSAYRLAFSVYDRVVKGIR